VILNHLSTANGYPMYRGILVRIESLAESAQTFRTIEVKSRTWYYRPRNASATAA